MHYIHLYQRNSVCINTILYLCQNTNNTYALIIVLLPHHKLKIAKLLPI